MECGTGDGREAEVRELFINDNGYLVQASCSVFLLLVNKQGRSKGRSYNSVLYQLLLMEQDMVCNQMTIFQCFSWRDNVTAERVYKRVNSTIPFIVRNTLP